jgi:hypothetical protein
VGGPPIESRSVLPTQDRTLSALADGQINCASSPRDKGNHRRLASFAHDAEGPVPLGEGQILDVGSARFADPKPVEAEEHGQSGMILVAALGCEEKGSQLPAIQSSPLGRVDLRAPDILGRVGGDPSVNVGEPVEAADGGEAPVDGRRGQALLLRGGAVELDVGSLGFQDGEACVGGPLEEGLQIVAVGIERSSAVSGEKCCRCNLSFIEAGVLDDGGQGVGI